MLNRVGSILSAPLPFSRMREKVAEGRMRVKKISRSDSLFNYDLASILNIEPYISMTVYSVSLRDVIKPSSAFGTFSQLGEGIFYKQ